MKLPSIGFVYLVAVVVSTVAFLNWTGSIPWYEESKVTGERIRKQAQYLEQIADRTDSVFLKAEWWKGAISIRMDRGEKEDTLRLSEKLFALPEDLQQGAWRYKFYEIFDMGARGSEEALALFKRGDRSDYILAAMADRVFDSPDDPYFQLVLEALEQSGSMVWLQGNDSAARGFAISKDGWTSGRDPGYLILKNRGDSPLMFTLKLANHASGSDLPITVTVSDGLTVQEGVFADKLRNVFRIPLDPVEPGEERIIRIKADKAWWSQGAVGRKLGIRVFLEEALALFERGGRSNYILAAMAERVFDSPDDPYFQSVLEALEESDSSVLIQGNDSAVRGFAISRDGWTSGQDPGYLILKNRGDSPLMFTLKLANHAPDSDLPITVKVSDGLSVREGIFSDELRDMLRIPLNPVEPGEERIIRIKADKAWWPQGADRRKLGIRVFLD